MRGLLPARLLHIAFAATAMLLGVLPILREHVEHGGLLQAVPDIDASSPDAYLAVAVKSFFALAMLLAVVFLARVRGGDTAHRIAGMPLVRTATVTAFTISVGLAAFDACAQAHGVSTEAGGVCSCWLTGAYSAGGALISALLILGGRAILAFARDVLRLVVDLVIRLALTSEVPARYTRCHPSIFHSGTSHIARRIAGRAPPKTEALFGI